MKREKTENKQLEPGILSRIIKIAAYPVAAISGYWVAGFSVRDSVYDVVKGKKNETFRQEYESAKHALVDEGIAAAKDHRPIDIASRMAEINSTFSSEIDKRLESLKLGGIRKQWKFIHRGEKQKALMYGFEAAAVVLGALLLVSSSKAVSGALKDNDAKTPEGPAI